MSIRVVVLTTQTPHHARFVSRLLDHAEVLVLAERAPPGSADPLRERFTARTEDYERHRWFNGSDPRLDDLAPTLHVPTANDPESLRWLSEQHIEVAVCFGTGILRAPTLQVLPPLRFNLHGGDPQRYRGLDSHLWSAYHGDRSGMVTALHHLSAEVDAGDLVGVEALALTGLRSLTELRARNTEAAVRLTVAALLSAQHQGWVPRWPQRETGRYYSSLPGALLERCEQRFAQLVAEGRT